MAGEDKAVEDEAGEQEAVPSLEAAYAVQTPEDNRKLYAEWAETYESGFMADSGYVYHRHVAAILLDGFGELDGPVLDVGCGTGVVGEELRTLGVSTVDGIDISPEMLALAATKTDDQGPVYRNLIEADLTQRIDVSDDSYAAMISVGAFTHGHLGPDALGELLRVGRPGARYAIGINAAHFEEFGFDERLDQHRAEATIEDYRAVDAVIYRDTDENNPNQMARVAVFTLSSD